jgi:pimeloyl-ACP methyl ester carboxylesterase
VAKVHIFVVPGISASQLQDTSANGLGLVWIDPRLVALGADFAALRRRPGDDGDAVAGVAIAASALLPLLFDPLINVLKHAFAAEVTGAPFDWRAGIPRSAAALAQSLRDVLGDPQSRVAIVAHSMGGLVAAAAIRQLSPAHAARVVGMVTMGTPWWGSYAAVLGLTCDLAGANPLAPLFAQKLATVRAVFQSFRGLVHLLPLDDPAVRDVALYAPETVAAGENLSAGLAELDGLVHQPPPRTVAIVSKADRETCVGVSRQGADLRWQRGPGDGAVSYHSATAGGSRAFEAIVELEAPHAAMPLYPSVMRATALALGTWIGGPSIWAKLLLGTAPFFERAIEQALARWTADAALLSLMPFMESLRVPGRRP